MSRIWIISLWNTLVFVLSLATGIVLYYSLGSFVSKDITMLFSIVWLIGAGLWSWPLARRLAYWYEARNSSIDITSK